MWWGILLLILIILGVVITIVVLNQGNIFNVIDSLPSYRIYSPTGDVYWGVLNTVGPLGANPNVPILNSVWTPVVNIGKEVDLDQWSFEPVTNSFVTLQPNQRLVKIINRVYEATNIGYTGSNNTNPTAPTSGFILVGLAPNVIPPSPTAGFRLLPVTNEGSATVFTYNEVGTNLFQLTIPEANQHVSFDAGGPIVVNNSNTQFPIATFETLPLAT